jgi:MFS family permease
MRDSPAAIARARWAVAAIFLLNGVVIGTWAAQIPLVEERLKISHSTLGMALLTMALGSLAAMPLTGPLIARFGSALVTRIATPVLFVAFPLALLAPSLGLFLPAALLFGAVNGVMDVAVNAHGVTVERRYGRPVMSSFHGMWSLGGLGGAGLAALLLRVMPPVAQALLTMGLVLIVAIAALSFLLTTAADGGNAGTRIVLPNKATLGLGILCFLCMTAEGAVLDWGALHLRSTLGAGPGLAATGFAAFSASMAAARLSGDRLRGRFGSVSLVRWSAYLAAVGLVIALFAPWTPLALVGFAMVGLGLANLVPVFFGAAGRIPGQSPGSAIAALATIGYSGFVVGPPFIGIVADATTLQTALCLVVLACLAIGFAAGVAEPARKGAPALA